MPHIVLKGQIKDKKKVHAYVHSLCHELGIGRMWSKVIFINFKTVLDDDNQGVCWGDTKEGYVDISIARSSEGVKIPYEMMMQTLAHEMVHVRQYIRGELSYGSSGEFQWKKRSAGGYKYENQPWEKEAIGLAEVLFTKCFPFHMDLVN